jgi:hypothetical protein
LPILLDVGSFIGRLLQYYCNVFLWLHSSPTFVQANVWTCVDPLWYTCLYTIRLICTLACKL